MILSRRDFLRIIAGAGLSAAVGSQWEAIRTGVSGEGDRADETVATRWQNAPAELASIDVGATWESRIKRAPHEFNAVGFLVAGQWLDLSMRVSADGGRWSDWLPVTGCRCQGQERPGALTPAGLISTPTSRFIQYRVTPETGKPAPGVVVDLINSLKGSTAPIATKAIDEPISRIQSSQPQPIVGREAWGANENWRFNGDGEEIWPREYRTLQKTFVHHTNTSDATDPAVTVRAIYYYHTISLGWGDIGYNFLIDRFGNIYEGRAGGSGVLGGHAASPSRGSLNEGSLGIGCIGTFNSQSPSVDMQRALARLIAWRCRYIPPHGDSYFVWNHLPNIMGHRDGMPGETDCPGDGLAGHLPALRGDVWWNLDYQTPAPLGSVASIKFSPENLAPGSTMRVDIEVANNGTGTMPTQGPPPGTTFQENETYVTHGFREVRGAFRAGVDYDRNQGGDIDYPYRWGLPDALEPGRRTTITGYIKLNAPQSQTYWAGLVEEDVRWHVEGIGNSVLKVDDISRPRTIFMPSIRQ